MENQFECFRFAAFPTAVQLKIWELAVQDTPARIVIPMVDGQNEVPSVLHACRLS